MATTAYSTALLGGARLAAVGGGAAAVPPSILLLRRRNGNLTPLRLQGENTIICGESAPLHSGNFSGCIILTVPRESDAPRQSPLRVRASSDDTSAASGDELIADLKAKVRASWVVNQTAQI
jgi:hypothetical protein